MGKESSGEANENLEERVETLEERMKKMLPGRREVLAGGAAAGAGLFGFGVGQASADGLNDGDTQWGSDSNRDDYVVDHLDGNSASIEQVYLGKLSSTPTDSEIGSGNVAFYAKDDGNLYKRPYGGSESQVGGGGGIFEDTDGDGVYEQTTGTGISVSELSGGVTSNNTITNLVGQGLEVDANNNLTAPNDPRVLDTFVDGDIAEYGGDTSDISVQTSTVYDGTYAITATASNVSITSTSGLPTYPTPGDTFSARVYSGGEYVGILYGVPSEAGDGSVSGYLVHATSSSNTINIQRSDSGTFTKLAETTGSIPGDEWLKIRVEWTTSGNHIVDLYSESGSLLAQLSVQDSDYTSQGLGWRFGNTPAHADYFVLE